MNLAAPQDPSPGGIARALVLAAAELAGALPSAIVPVLDELVFRPDMVQAYLGRLVRTGVIVTDSAWGGSAYKPTPLLDEMIALLKE